MKVGIGFICRRYLKILVLLSQIISTWKILIQKWGYRNENQSSGQNQSLNLYCVTASTGASWAWLYMEVETMVKIILCFSVDLLQSLKKRDFFSVSVHLRRGTSILLSDASLRMYPDTCYTWLHNCSFLLCPLSAKGSSKLWRSLILLVMSSVLLLEPNHVNWKLKGDRGHGTEWALFLAQGHSSYPWHHWQPVRRGLCLGHNSWNNVWKRPSGSPAVILLTPVSMFILLYLCTNVSELLFFPFVF